MSLLRPIATVGGLTLVSRMLGFVRDILIAAILGAGLVADCFFVAFKIPNFFRRLFAEGAFSAAFVPMFSELLARDKAAGTQSARAFAENALALLLLVLLLFVVALQVAMPWAMYGLAPGFVGNQEKFDLAVALTRLTFPYLIFISLVSLFGGVLNSLHRFAAVAFTPVLMNLSLIAAVTLLARYTETPGHALAWGVAGAGVVQFVWLCRALRGAGFMLRLPRPRLNSQMKQFLRLMIPGAIGAGVTQINLLIDVLLASLLPDGSLSYLFYADRLNQLPMGVVGIAVGTALLPLMSRLIAIDDEAGAVQSQNRALETSMLLTIPAAVALAVVALPIITILFERGAFDTAASGATAAALMAYAVGLPAYVAIKVLVPGFFARKDTATPVRIAIAAVGINLILNLLLIGPLAHVGLALATALSAWVNAGLLLVILYRRGNFAIDARLASRLPRILLAAAVMGAGLWLLNDTMIDEFQYMDGPLAVRVGGLVGLVVGGIALYAVAALLFGAVKRADLKAVIERSVDQSEQKSDKPADLN